MSQHVDRGVKPKSYEGSEVILGLTCKRKDER